MVGYTTNLRLRVPVFDQDPWDEDINGDLYVLDAAVGKFFGVADLAGLWKNDTSYHMGVSVVDYTDGSIWTAAVTHTSPPAPTTFAEDRAASPTHWVESISSAQEYAEAAAGYANSAALAADAAAQSAQDAADSEVIVSGALPRTGGTMTGPLILYGDPTNVLESATKQYVDARVGGVGFLPTTGGEMTGPITLFGNPTQPLHSTPKQYVDTFMPRSGGVFTGQITLAGDPTGNLNATTKQYVDTNYMPKAGGAFTGNITAPNVTATTNLTGNALVLSGGARWTMDGTNSYLWMDGSNWRWQYERGNGTMRYIRGYDGATLFTIDNAGNASCASSFNAPGTARGGSIMSAGGAFYVADNYNYYLARNPSDGNWHFVENGQVNATIGTDGTLALRGQGVVYSAYGANRWAFQWNGEGTSMLVDGANVGYVLRSYDEAPYSRMIRMGLNSNGSISAWYPGGVVWWAINWSDRRLKSNIQPTRVDALEQVNQLKVYECDFKAPIEGATTEHVECTLLADEVAEVVPNAFVKAQADGYDGIKELPLIATLVRAMQQMTNRIEQLEAQIAASA